MRVLSIALCAFFFAGIVAAGCKKPAPATGPQGAAPAPVEVVRDGGCLFTYVEPNGTFATTDTPGNVPEAARKIVRVTDPSRTLSDKQDPTKVFVIDVSELLKTARIHARPLDREAFETAALAQLPPGESSPRCAAPPAPPQPPPAAAAAPTAPAAPSGPVVATLYGTSWCGACRTARQYFTERKIPFADKDVERDPAAARELADKAAKLGVPADRVPIIDIRGRLLIGFDRARVEAALGDAT